MSKVSRVSWGKKQKTEDSVQWVSGSVVSLEERSLVIRGTFKGGHLSLVIGHWGGGRPEDRRRKTEDSGSVGR